MTEIVAEPVATGEAPGNPGDNSRRTNPLGFVVGSIRAVGNAILPLGFVIYQVRDEPLGLMTIAGIGLAVTALIFGVSFLDWRMRTYRVGGTDIRVDSGILSRSARSVPYERIQDVSLEQSLIPRLFGLVEVRFETGAGGKDELKLTYLSEDEGARLRDVIRARKDDGGAETIAGSEPAADFAAEPPPLFAMPPKRVVTFGLFEFSLVVMAVIGGLAQQFEPLLPFDLWDFDWWQSVLAGPGSQLAGLGMMAQMVGGVIAIGSLIVLGVLTGLIRTILRDWNFRLDRTDKGFRRRRGLLTRTDVLMPAHRVQALVQSTGIIRSWFGWHGLKFVSLAQDSGSASHDVAPFAKVPELQPIIASSGFAGPPADLEWCHTSLKARIDTAIIIAVFFGLLSAGLLALFTQIEFDVEIPFSLAFLPMVGAAFLILREAFLYRYDRHGWDDRHIFIRNGWLARQLRIASRVKLHSVQIVQGPLAQRRGYADVHLGLAGGTLAAEGIALVDACAMRAAILNSIAEKDFSQLEGMQP